MGNRLYKKIAIAAVAVSVVSFNAMAAQINLLTDTINFRTSADTSKTTKHNGNMIIVGMQSTNQKALEVVGKSKVAGFHYAVSGTDTSVAGYGFGGTFRGGAYGVRGEALKTGTGSRYGGYFNATNGASNIGVYATAGTCTTTAWAGYFNGNVYCAGTYQSSDAMLKKDITPIDSALTKIMKLSPKSYYYDADKLSKLNLPKAKQNGLIAQEVEQVFPDLVSTAAQPNIEEVNGVTTETTTSFKCINYTALIPVLIGSIQEQQKRIVALEAALKMK